MADYRPSPWRPYYQKGHPAGRNPTGIRNYRPYSRYIPHVDPRFFSACYHRGTMPHMHDPCYSTVNVDFPPAVAGYSGFTVPMTSEHPQHASNAHCPRYL